MMVRQQQRRPDRCFLPVGSNNVTLVQFPTQRRAQPSTQEAHSQLVRLSAPSAPENMAPVRETQEEDGETEAKRIHISDTEETLTNRETAPEPCDQTGSDMCALDDRVSPGEGIQQVELGSSEDNRAAELASAGCLKVTIQRSSESREFGEKEPGTERFTCHLCYCTLHSAQAFQQHMSGAEHQHRLHQISQSVALSQHTGWRSGACERWCELCQIHFTGDVVLHRRSKQHKESKKLSRPFCHMCRRHFRTPRKFVEHMKSPEHKHKVQLEKSHEDELITVDAVGCFESEPKINIRSERGETEGGDEERGSKKSRDKSISEDKVNIRRIGLKDKGDKDVGKLVGGEKDIGSQEEVGKDVKQDKEKSRRAVETRRAETSGGDKDAQLGARRGGAEDKDRGDDELGDNEERRTEPKQEDLKVGNQNKTGGENKEKRGDKRIGDKERGDEGVGNKEKGDTEEGLDAEMVEEDVNLIVEGVERDVPHEVSLHAQTDWSYVVPVSGFFCRLCHKFFFRETSAREQHCSTPQHIARIHQVQRRPDLTRADPEFS